MVVEGPTEEVVFALGASWKKLADATDARARMMVEDFMLNSGKNF